MNELIINVDAGEAEPGSKHDLELLDHVDAVNIALGGHAGDPGWSRELCDEAVRQGKRVHLHPGLPDREGFGRKPISISWDDLARSLTLQRNVLREIRVCKFHGLLYNQAVSDAKLADRYCDWCSENDIAELLAPFDSRLAIAARQRGIAVLCEAFVDRRYLYVNDQLVLQSRAEHGAVIDSVDEVVAQAESIRNGLIQTADAQTFAIQCDTLCLHGDHHNSIDLAQAIALWKKRS